MSLLTGTRQGGGTSAFDTGYAAWLGAGNTGTPEDYIASLGGVGGGGFTAQDEATILGPADTLRVVGSGADLTETGGVATLTIPGIGEIVVPTSGEGAYVGDWAPNTAYLAKQLVKNVHRIYSVRVAHTSGTTFDYDKFDPIPGTTPDRIRDMTVQPGREWCAAGPDWNGDVDTALFDITGTVQRVNDSKGIPVLRVTDPDAVTVLTKQRDIKDGELFVKFWPKATGQVSNAVMSLYARYLSATNHWRGYKRFNATNPVEVAESVANGVSANQSQGGKDTAFYPRAARVRVEEDAILWKCWPMWITHVGTHSQANAYVAGDGVQTGAVSSTARHWVAITDIPVGGEVPSDTSTVWRDAVEPADWQIVRRLRSGNSGSTDNVDAGGFGIGLARLTCDIYDLSVVENQRTDPNIVWNAGWTVIDTTDGMPVGWRVDGNPTPGNSVGWVDIEDPLGGPVFGGTRKALRMSITDPDAAAANVQVPTQSIFSSRHQSRKVGGTRSRPHPRAAFAKRMLVSLWTKGVNIQNPAPAGLGVTFGLDLYTYALAPGIRMSVATTSLGAYFWSLGADGPTAHALGTWDWREIRFVMELNKWAEIYQMDVQIVRHNLAVTGELWVLQPTITPIA